MRLFGFEITRARAAPPGSAVVPARGSGNWFPMVREPSTGAWQRNEEITAPSALSYFAVFGCVTLIASDIGKLKLDLVALNEDGVWEKATNPAYSPVLRKPNRYQTTVKFIEQWITSKLTYGNTYVLKQRDERGVVTALYVLDPARVTPLIAPDGAVYYELQRDDLSGTRDLEAGKIVVPSREIIHDRMVTLFHPLVGVTPLFACGLAAMQGLTIQSQSERFFRNGSNPGGVLTAPGKINDDTAKRLKDYWETNFGGENVGKVAVVGDDLKYQALTVNAVDAQLIEQLKWTAHNVCTCYHVPPAMLDIGTETTPANLEPLLQKYHSQCIQSLLTSAEACLDEGLELKAPYGTEFDIDDLIWLDTDAKTKAAADSIRAGALSPNEARKKYYGIGPTEGGDTPYMQQQMYSLRALAERDADKPFSKPAPSPTALPPSPDDDLDELDTAAFGALLTKALEGIHEG